MVLNCMHCQGLQKKNLIQDSELVRIQKKKKHLRGAEVAQAAQTWLED